MTSERTGPADPHPAQLIERPERTASWFMVLALTWLPLLIGGALLAVALPLLTLLSGLPAAAQTGVRIVGVLCGALVSVSVVRFAFPIARRIPHLRLVSAAAAGCLCLILVAAQLVPSGANDFAGDAVAGLAGSLLGVPAGYVIVRRASLAQVGEPT